ncbi:DUF4012 domain-containing protein [Patescibacteria group bacterium]|nr:DUF4012 domain-containing protein [Patescibacteria group bacterium]MBU1705753.1 DUF4012 domain-containing protein [Patescibacteria group bacterium]
MTEFHYPDYQPEPVIEPKSRPNRRNLWLGLALATIVLVVLGGILAVAAGQVLSSAYEGKAALERARAEALDLNFEAAEEYLYLADQEFAKADRGFLVLNTISFIPWVGSQIEAADVMLKSGREVIAALIEIVDLGGELMRLSGLSATDLEEMLGGLEPSMTFDDLPSETKRAILLRFSSSAAELELLQNKLAIAQEELARLPKDELVSPILIALEPVTEQLAVFESTLRIMAIASSLLPEFAGLDQESTHLLLFLNNGELRPGGGFIGTYGILKMKDADIVSLETKDVYNLDNPASPYLTQMAPEPLQRYNAADKWFFRDANWSPDFGVSSRQALELFNEEVRALPPAVQNQVQMPVSIQHVIGFTPTFASELLRLTGPIAVGGQTFTPENVFDLLEYQVEFGYAEQGIPLTQRKEILADLVAEMKVRLLSLPLAEWSRLIEVSQEAWRTKQLVMYSEEQALEDVLTRVGWGGRMVPWAGDQQLVVDANMGSLKSDRVVKRTVKYEIFQNSDGQYLGRTTIKYDHQGNFDYQTTRYRTYTRLYLPLGSEWLKTKGALVDDQLRNPKGESGTVEVGEDLGFTTFGAFIAIEPGATGELVFEYRLAPSVVRAIEAHRYQLSWLKQIGTANYPLTLDLDFDKKVTSAMPAEAAEGWGDDVYHLNTFLDQDLIFNVSL